jgi:nicotinamide-nucleotide amidase
LSDIEDLAARLVEALTQRDLTLALAESTTGGLIGSLITDVPGSSKCFLGSVVPYSNDAKEALLGVPKQTMIDHGSVSAETALAMARGARERFGADIAAGITGISGPGGGTAEKPVGLVHIAAVGPGDAVVQKRFVWDGGRAENKRRSAIATLAAIVEIVEKSSLGGS